MPAPVVRLRDEAVVVGRERGEPPRASPSPALKGVAQVAAAVEEQVIYAAEDTDVERRARLVFQLGARPAYRSRRRPALASATVARQPLLSQRNAAGVFRSMAVPATFSPRARRNRRGRAPVIEPRRVRLSPGATLAARGALASLLAVVVLASAASSRSSPLTPDEVQSARPWVANGRVTAAVRVGERTVIGGAFTRIGPVTGPGVLLSPADGRPLAGFPTFAGGAVDVVVADGRGGWFVGGSFHWAGGLRRLGLAHVLADGTVDRHFDPAPEFVDDARVYPGRIVALQLGAGRLYVGGWFTRIGGVPRSALAALDDRTGEVVDWDPHLQGSTVDALALGDDELFVAGGFSEVGGERRVRAAALDLDDGRATAWDPAPDGIVYALAAADGVVYMGGRFARAGGAPRRLLAAVDGTTGRATAWTPDVAGDRVLALVPVGDVVVVGSGPSPPRDQRGELAAVARVDGTRRWTVAAHGGVHALAVRGGEIVAGGSFSRLGGRARSGLGAVALAGGNVSAWAPRPDLLVDDSAFRPSAVRALANGARGVVAGGDFASVGGVARARLAALDARGRPLAWNPGADSGVASLARGHGRVYAVGRFRTIAGKRRNGAAAFDLRLRLLRWQTPPLDPAGTANTVQPLGRLVVVTGFFNRVPPGDVHGSLAAFDAETGRLVDWGPPNLAGNGVGQVLAAGGRVFAVGVDPTTSTVVELDRRTGRVVRRLIRNRGTGDVYAIALRGRTLYLGGAMVSVNGERRAGLAAVDIVTRRLLAWRPTVDGKVDSLLVRGDVVYAAGQFLGVGGQQRTGLAALDARTGRVLGWNPQLSGYAHRIQPFGQGFYVVGDFPSAGSLPQPYLAFFS